MFSISVHMETRALWPLLEVQMPALQQPHRVLPRTERSQALLLGLLQVLMWTLRDKRASVVRLSPCPILGPCVESDA